MQSRLLSQGERIVLAALREGRRLRAGVRRDEAALARLEKFGLVELFPRPALTTNGEAVARDLPALESLT